MARSSRDFENGTIILSRDSGFADRFRAYNVWLDRQNKLGVIKNGETKEFRVEDGDHTLVVTIDWGSSNVLVFNMPAEQQIRFRVRSSARGLRILLSPWYATIRSKSYLRLERDI